MVHRNVRLFLMLSTSWWCLPAQPLCQAHSHHRAHFQPAPCQSRAPPLLTIPQKNLFTVTCHWIKVRRNESKWRWPGVGEGQACVGATRVWHHQTQITAFQGRNSRQPGRWLYLETSHFWFLSFLFLWASAQVRWVLRSESSSRVRDQEPGPFSILGGGLCRVAGRTAGGGSGPQSDL